MVRRCLLALLGLVLPCHSATATSKLPGNQSQIQSSNVLQGRSIRDYNERLEQLQHQAVSSDGDAAPGDYRIGPEDLLNITVYGAPI